MGETKPYHHGNLREALLEAGMVLLRERGASGITLRACAAEAGVSHAAPAHHFDDMRTLLSVLAAEGYTALASRLGDARKAAGSDAGRAIEALGTAYVQFALSERALFALMSDTERTDAQTPELADAVAAMRKHLAAVSVPASRRTGPAGPHTPALMETFLWSMLQGAAQLALSGHMENGADAEKDGPAMRQAVDMIKTVSALMLEG